MSKLTKPQIREHEKAVKLAERGNLSADESRFVYENYREDAEHINSRAGAHFTPFGLASDFTLHIPYIYERTIKIVDLCAGIGVLSYAASLEGDEWSRCYSDITCVEINPDYVKIGKQLLPNAKWICGDALDPDLLGSLGRFDFAIANPPHGFVKSRHKKAYISGEGNVLDHCVGGYAGRIAEGNTAVLFIRSKSEPDKPLCTVEYLRNYERVGQCSGYDNKLNVQSIKDFIEERKEIKKIA